MQYSVKNGNVWVSLEKQLEQAPSQLPAEFSFEEQLNDRALQFYTLHSSQKIPQNQYTRNCSPTHTNPISAKQMQFNCYTSFLNDNNNEKDYLRASRNICGDKTPRADHIIKRKHLTFFPTGEF